MLVNIKTVNILIGICDLQDTYKAFFHCYVVPIL
jgi:hypothetical protein